jgi:hypothetical protein
MISSRVFRASDWLPMPESPTESWVQSQRSPIQKNLRSDRWSSVYFKNLKNHPVSYLPCLYLSFVLCVPFSPPFCGSRVNPCIFGAWKPLLPRKNISLRKSKWPLAYTFEVALEKNCKVSCQCNFFEIFWNAARGTEYEWHHFRCFSSKFVKKETEHSAINKEDLHPYGS